MRRLAPFALALPFVLPYALAASASAADLDTKGPLYCALVDVYDCSPGECAEIESESVALPDVLRIDPAKKTATALDQEFEGASSPLDSVELVAGKIVARGQQVDRLLVVSIDVAGGDAIVTVTDPKTTLVAYAECVGP